MNQSHDRATSDNCGGVILCSQTPEFSCVGAGLDLSRSRSAARPRQMERSVGLRHAIESEDNRRATNETGRLPVTR